MKIYLDDHATEKERASLDSMIECDLVARMQKYVAASTGDYVFRRAAGDLLKADSPSADALLKVVTVGLSGQPDSINITRALEMAFAPSAKRATHQLDPFDDGSLRWMLRSKVKLPGAHGMLVEQIAGFIELAKDSPIIFRCKGRALRGYSPFARRLLTNFQLYGKMNVYQAMMVAFAANKPDGTHVIEPYKEGASGLWQLTRRNSNIAKLSK